MGPGPVRPRAVDGRKHQPGHFRWGAGRSPVRWQSQRTPPPATRPGPLGGGDGSPQTERPFSLRWVVGGRPPNGPRLFSRLTSATSLSTSVALLIGNSCIVPIGLQLYKMFVGRRLPHCRDATGPPSGVPMRPSMSAGGPRYRRPEPGLAPVTGGLVVAGVVIAGAVIAGFGATVRKQTGRLLRAFAPLTPRPRTPR